MKHRVTPFMTIVGALALQACAMPTTTEAVPPIEEIDSQIVEAVASSTAVDREITEVEIASSVPVPMRTDNDPQVPAGVVLPPDAVQPITVDFQGPIEEFLGAMAVRSGYLFTIAGDAPANPIMISIPSNDEPLFGVIRRAGNLANGAADIVFNPTKKAIEIRYDE